MKSIMMMTLSLLAVSGWAATPAPKAETKPAAGKTAAKDESKTNMSFDELLIQGQFHFSDEAVITVENDKVLDALLGVRKDFKDRIQQSAAR